MANPFASINGWHVLLFIGLIGALLLWVNSYVESVKERFAKLEKAITDEGWERKKEIESAMNREIKMRQDAGRPLADRIANLEDRIGTK